MGETCPVRRAALAKPDAPALRGDDLSWTWRDYDAAVNAACGGLRRAGVGPGDRVAVLAANSPAYAALIFAVLRRGAILAPLNLRRGEAHGHALLSRLDPKLVCVDAARRDIAADYATLEIARFPDAPADEAELAPDREAAIVFTSGSGGVPKGVVLTAGNLLAGAAAANAALPLAADDGWLLDLPLYHVGGLAILLRAARAGCAVRVRDGFAPAAALDDLAAGRVTVLSCVPAMLRALLAADPEGRILARAKAILLGGGAIDPRLLDDARARGLRVLPTYGMTEAGSQIYTDGRLLPGMELRVVDGEIAICGSAVFTRYLDDASPTRDDEGWFRTGDLGRLHEDGRLEVLGRRDEIFVSGGENVHPAEIEKVALEFVGLDECAVISAPSRRWGRRPVLFATPANLDAPALHVWLSGRLPKLLVPDDVVAVASLPRLTLGKIDRSALLERYLDAQDEGGG